MPTTYPTSIDTFTTKTDGVSDVLAEDVNKLQGAVVAIETKLGSGTTIPNAALGSGTANSTTFLRGDRTWASVSDADTLDGQHASAFATASHNHAGSGAGAVGSYGFTVTYQSLPTVGSTYAGQYGLPAGTWRCMAAPGAYLFDGANQGTYYFILWLRIA